MNILKSSHPIRWGIIGCGGIAQKAVCPAIRWSGLCRLHAIASRDPEKARALTKELEAERFHDSYDSLLADDEIDAVYIGLPNGLHHEWSRRALEAGKHVLCEKAFVMEPAHAEELSAMASGKGLRLMEAYMYRHHPQWQTVFDHIDRGSIGEVRSIRAIFQGTNRNARDHRWSAKIGGGALYDLTCYAVNVSRYLFDSEPLGVMAMADLSTDEGVDRTSSALLDYGNGRSAYVSGSFSLHFNQSCEIIGLDGLLRIERPFGPGWEDTRLTLENSSGRETISIDGANQFLHMVEHFAQRIADPTLSLDPGESGVNQARVLKAMERSWETGARVSPAEGA